ncbi:hypothetical protein JW916_16025 [Candidatus Sumerlaeota bacterium]|nr:hypothetical protein [Candidatus Sumerlaeota bacterium]
MTKIFEALEHAREERQETLGRPVEVRHHGPSLDLSFIRSKAAGGPGILSMPVLHLSEKMTALYQSINSLLSGEGPKTVQFMGIGEGHGTSTLTREFAKTCAFALGRSVLLLDAHQVKPTHLRHFNVTPQHGWEECVCANLPLEHAIHQIGEGQLYACQLSVKAPSALWLSDRVKTEYFIDNLRSSFDFTLVDTPSATASPEGIALTQLVDGVVLVIESEKVRRQVAVKVKEKIEQHSGRILGVILNKRKLPIPEFIYNRL